MKIRFVGAVGTVTGSCTLLEHNGEYVLVDRGAGQDSVADADTPFDFKPRALRLMFLTHARWNRSAVPFNLVYLPGRAEPAPLPELLTPGIVLGAFAGP
jgi:Cft2 family RNA processing exonuclease